MSVGAPIHEALARAVRGDVRMGRHDRMLYATDASIYQVEPLGVVIPADVDDAEAAARACFLTGTPVVPRGAGTALAGQTVNRGVVIDLSANCRAIPSIDVAARRVRVEPGVVLDQLNGALAKHGLAFGPDVATASHATLGGMIGNNSAGANSVLYGRTVEHVVAIDALLSSGERLRFDEGAALRSERVREITAALAEIVLPLAPLIDERFPKILRHVDGYNLDILLTQLRASTPGTFDRVNLAHLLCGSEGTLAITLGADLALVDRPTHKGLAIAAFASVRDALEPLTRILATGPSAVELVDDMVITMARRNRALAHDVDVLPQPSAGSLGAVIYVQYFADSAAELATKLDGLASTLPGVMLVRHTDPASMERAWRLRKAGEPLLHGIPGARKPVTFVEDTAVDPAHLSAFVEEFRAIVERHGTTAAYYAHASVGCLHIRPLIALEDEHDLARMRAIAVEVADLVVKYKGALSGEHGDGRVRSPMLSLVLGPDLAKALGRIKRVFDPSGLLNPGNLVDNDRPDAITSRLRVRPDDARFVHAPTAPTYYSYEREGGLDHAITGCNGAGLCRRLTDGGTMCPSFRALRDERHTTRGRANALRLAISGQLSRTPWHDEETARTLALCLSCKACKSECPSNVDLAKLKAEFTAQGFNERGAVPWRVRLRSAVRGLSRTASAAWPLSAWISRWGPTRQLIAHTLGFSSTRSLPAIGPPLRRWLQHHRRESLRRRGPESLHDRPCVVLFGDCFTQWSEPAVGAAAVTVLEAFGYRVVLFESGCCARGAISCGHLADAARTVAATAQGLEALVARVSAVAVLCLEPSCLSALKDDWLELRSGIAPERLRAISQRAHLVEDWIDREWDRHPTRPSLSHPEERVVFHAHCHQKALWGSETSSRLLARIFGDRLEVLATGCCGMAGAFGLDASTSDLSVAIAQMDLLPKLARDARAIVCASGTSCRHQIHDTVSRRAFHPIELVASAIMDRDPVTG